MRLKHLSYVLPLRLRSLFRRNQVEKELDEEMQYHLDRQIGEHIARGMSPEDAKSAALRALAASSGSKRNPATHAGSISSTICFRIFDTVSELWVARQVSPPWR